MDKDKRQHRPDGAERRRFPRYKSYSIIQILAENGKGFSHTPTLVNMSEGGLCFYCDDLIALNDRIHIQINITELNCTVATMARVAWSQSSTEHVNSHLLGVEFVGIDENDCEILRRLESAARQKK